MGCVAARAGSPERGGGNAHTGGAARVRLPLPPGAGTAGAGRAAVPDQDGYPLTRGSLYLCIRRLRRRCGIPRLAVHLFRHTFAVSNLKAGGDMLTLQRILGHTSLRMVNHYAHLAHRT